MLKVLSHAEDLSDSHGNENAGIKKKNTGTGDIAQLM